MPTAELLPTQSPVAPDAMLPRPFRVLRRTQETRDTVTLTLAPVDGVPLVWQPGQFTMLYAFGVGEVPISISGDAKSGLLVHTIRDVGGVTRALAAARRGDVLGVRGPMGTGWGVHDAAGDDVLVVAGGIGLAPLRPVVHHLLAHRRQFGRVSVLYGTRRPEDMLFRREVERWRGRFDLDVAVTVDAAGSDWRGPVGLVTSLIPRARFNPEHTLAVVCGPEIMMRFVTTVLADTGVPPERVRVSMERTMLCGVGVCGHCQLREMFVCTDGPVFDMARIGPLMSLREV